MTYWQGVVLGIVQGLTEFLPVSSSGHLVVAQEAVGLSAPGVLVEVTLHVATLFAVVVVYRTQLWALARGAFAGSRDAWRYLALLLIASIPAGVVGVLWAEWFERAFESLLLVGVNFTLTGAILWTTRAMAARAARSAPTTAGSLVVGAAQALAILPGISRSGSTVAAAMWLGVEPVRAAEFSFLLALPAIAGAGLLEAVELGGGAPGVAVGPLAVSFLAALVSGVLAIRLLVVLLRRRAFHRFAPYCWTIGAVTIAWALMR